MLFEKKELCNFLVDAKKSTYASGDWSQKIVNDDKSTTLIFEHWNWKYHDNYFGGEPYGGREVVFFKWKPIYIMTYYGRVYNSISDINRVYEILMSALKLIPKNNPYRWPKKYNNWDFSYINSFNWEINDFYGEEIILEKWNKIYEARYIWGFVDIKKPYNNL